MFLSNTIKKDSFRKRDLIYALTKCYVKRSLILFSFLLLSRLMLIPYALSWDRPFNNAANWIGTGLMEIPNARILEDGVVRFGAAQALPYRWYGGGMGILPGLELSGRLTNITNIQTPYTFTNLDRAFDMKYQLLPESKEMPAIAIGINDFLGDSQLFPSEYIVISRQYYPFDLTLGIGSKRLRGPLTLPFNLPILNPFDLGQMDEFGLFGGIELALHDRLHLLAEYNPIQYDKDLSSGRGVPEGAKSPINVGLRAKLLRGMDLGLSYQRGDTVGLKFHIQAEIGKPILPHRSNPPPQVSIDRRPFRERDHKEMVEKIHEAIHEVGFSDVSVYTDGRSLIAEFENTRYLSNQKAVGRVLRILLFHSPSDTEKLSAVLRRRDMPILKVSVKPDHLEKFLLGKIPEDLFYTKLINLKTTKQTIDPHEEDYIKANGGREKRFKLSIKPDLTTFWLDATNYVQVRPGIKPYMQANIWKGALAYARYDIPFYSNVSASAQPSPNPVRTDQAKYMNKNYTFDRLLVNQAFRVSEKAFGRLSLGYFEKMYAGIGGETLYFPGEGKIAFGIEGDWVIKRVPGKQFELMDFKRYSVLSNFYYFYPGLDITLQAKYGRFLAGDIGWMFDISRQYNTGTIIGIFYSFTDTDIFTDRYNRGYNHKGVYLSFPIRMFLTRDSNQMFNYGISPWTRDVAATVSHWQDLFGLGKDLMPAKFKTKLDEIKE
ncbi:YjbH domain-containing protein [Thermodesulfobacteriota bacterium]